MFKQLSRAIRRNATAEQAAREERKAKEIAREEREQAEAIIKLENADQKARANKYITASEFLLLAEKYNITLPIRLIGWIKAHCGDIKCEGKYPCGEGYLYTYIINFFRDKAHKSTTFAKYADELFKAMDI